MKYKYANEDWLLVITQNNCEFTGISEIELLDEAWQFFKTYLVWEDNNIDNPNKTFQN